MTRATTICVGDRVRYSPYYVNSRPDDRLGNCQGEVKDIEQSSGWAMVCWDGSSETVDVRTKDLKRVIR
jgi:hypothetical protein